MATREKADAVIVGAGAAGAVFAAVLSRAGKHVVVLEQGPDWQLSDLISSDIWARRLRGSGPAIVYEGRHPVGRTADHGWGTGGAALHYSANFPRLLPSDFNMKSEHGRGLDWPISYADVAPYYDRVAREIGVSGDAKAEGTDPAHREQDRQEAERLQRPVQHAIERVKNPQPANTAE
jgi:choline dehydrogenase-like flavoprotein